MVAAWIGHGFWKPMVAGELAQWVRALAVSPEDQVGFLAPTSSSQSSITPVPGNPMLFSGLCEYHIYVVHRQIYRQNTYTQKSKFNFFFKFTIRITIDILVFQA